MIFRSLQIDNVVAEWIEWNLVLLQLHCQGVSSI